VVIGSLLPQRHSATRRVRLQRSPAEVWALLHDVGGFAAWRPQVRKVEHLPTTADGRTQWLDVGEHGAVRFEMVEATAPGS
jgi:hypothetical protein